MPRRRDCPGWSITDLDPAESNPASAILRMANPPGLAFATSIAGSDAPTVAYATVYPLTTLLRILSAQVLAIVLFR